MKTAIPPVLFLFYTCMAFSETPEDGIYVLLSSAENSFSKNEILSHFYEIPRIVMLGGEIIDLRGEFFYPSDCNKNSGGRAHFDLSQSTTQKKEDGLFFVNKELYVDLDNPFSDYSIYSFNIISQDSFEVYSLYGRDVVYGILRFDTPTEATYSLTSAQAFFTGEGLNASSCIVRETARLVKVQ